MQLIEANGGYGKACASGLIDEILHALGDARDKAVSSRRRPFTGTSQFANPAEKVLGRIETLDLDSRRGTQMYEGIRLRTERHAALSGHSPTVLLAEFGDVKMRGARSSFAANFFACAGFEIVTQRFACAAEIASSNADLIVLCSSDAEYNAMATAVMKELKAAERETPVIVAGNPESAEQLRAVGVADFIHVRSNPVEVLTSWQDRLGIEAGR
jgi:methylmalonyl-CoA mutase